MDTHPPQKKREREGEPLKSREPVNSYIVSRDILPEAILKTAQAKDLLVRGDALTVNEAVDKVGISRSAFYKYRDGIFPYTQSGRDKIIALTLLLEHRSGVLSNVLNTVALLKGNILSINQGVPVQGVAVATMSVNITEVKDSDAMIERLRHQQGVKRVEIVSQK
ncbi:MAG TPA: ACT domain-containing protein [Peptococcaceae bacterium]|nr:ACT domain-containing protein [Peptococcaceae bacterium]